MRTPDDLRSTIRRIDGKGYKAYTDIAGAYDFGEYILHVDHVQGDPFAAPSRVRVRVPQKLAGFDRDLYSNRSREVALRDYLTRRFGEACHRTCRGRRGTGSSGVIAIDRPGQEMLERTSFFVTDAHIEARFVMGLPAHGRSVAGRQAESMFFAELPQIVKASLLRGGVDRQSMERHVSAAEDADSLRTLLDAMGLVAFVANGSVLPRATGVDPRPLKKGRVVPFVSPKSLEGTVDLPNGGRVSGMGIPLGITLIAGGGYHGKSTLLRALELGVYNHIPGDGRELVVSSPDAVKVRAEDGRRVERVDISPFISNLPFGRETSAFSTDDASGSTSQAAGIIEALELGAGVLLIDEDTSATNFMIRDHRMQELVAKEREPITPFLDKVVQLNKELGVSTVLVMGGSGDYFDVADTVISMEEYVPVDVTKQAMEIAGRYRAERTPEGGEHFGNVTQRVPLASSFDPSKGRKEVKISPRGLHSIVFGTHSINLGSVEQLVDASQTRAIGDAIYYSTRYMDGECTLRHVVELVMADTARSGLDVLNSRPMGDYAEFRGLELGAAINRLRTLAMKSGT